MATINQYFDFAQLAQASYALLSSGMSYASAVNALKDPDTSEFTQKQAEIFASGYTVLSQRTDVSGFSATLFQDASGKKFLAIRGTQITDIGDLAYQGRPPGYAGEAVKV